MKLIINEIQLNMIIWFYVTYIKSVRLMINELRFNMRLMFNALRFNMRLCFNVTDMKMRQTAVQCDVVKYKTDF